MSFFIFNPLKIALVDDMKFIKKFKLDYVIQFVDYMNDAHCLYIAGSIPRNLFFKELPPMVKKLIPSKIEAPSHEFKPLPKDLKYVFLEPKETFPVVISMYLEENQEEYLKGVLGWNMVDIKDMNPPCLICTHRIAL